MKMLKLLIIALFAFLSALVSCKKKDLTGYIDEDSVYVPVFSMQSGQYDSPRYCTLSVYDEDAVMLFTLDGSPPDQGSSDYRSPIFIDSNTRLNVRTFYEDDWVSDIISMDYEFLVKPPAASPPGGVYRAIPYVALASETPGSVIRYALGDTAVTENSDVYINPLAITDDVILYARAFKAGWTPSQTIPFKYDLNKLDPPVISPPNGVYSGPVEVSLVSAVPNAILRYTLNGPDPAYNTGTLYTGVFQIQQSAIIKARAFLPDAIPSEVAIVQLDISGSQFTSDLLIKPPTGNYGGIQQVEILTQLPGAQIRYTTDGTEPTEHSALYTGPLPVLHSLILKAKTFHPSKKPGPTASATFTITTPVPLFNPPGGNYAVLQKVALGVPGQPQAIIYYTLDGSNPDTSSPVYSSPILLHKPMTIKAMAVDIIQNPSPVATASYDFKVPVKSLSVADLEITSLSGSYAPLITWNPPNATDKSYTLTFSKQGIVALKDGRIIPLSKGQVIGTVTSTDGQIKAQFIIQVEPKGGASGSLKLISPNGGEKWLPLSVHPITWFSRGVDSDVRIEYTTGSGWRVIASRIDNDGNFNWTVPEISSKSVVVRLLAVDGTAADTSDSFFEINNPGTQKSLNLSQPNGGEKWFAGNKQYILWNSKGIGNSVRLEYTTGSSWKTITAQTINDGAYLWTVPDDPSKTVQVRLLDEYGFIRGLSNGFFEIAGNVTPNNLNISWVKSAGGSGTDRALSIAADAMGNTYLTGEFQGAASFGDVKLSSYGGSDAFVAKYDSKGNVLWAKGITSAYRSKGLSIAVISGDLFLLGSYKGGIQFAGKKFDVPVGGKGLFLARYSSEGLFYWARPIENAEAGEYGRSLAVDGSGNVVITGFFEGKMELGDTVLVSQGQSEIFLAKYDRLGNLKWVVQAGGPGADRGFAIGFGTGGKIFVTGNYEGTAQFGDKKIKGSSSCCAPFTACYDGNGKIDWVSTPHISGCGSGTHLVAGSDWSITVIGEFYGMASFGSENLYSKGKGKGQDIFITNYNSSFGSVNWAESAGGDGMDYSRSLAVGAQGDIYTLGNFEGTAYFGEENIKAATKQDMFLARYNSQGEFKWVEQLSGDLAPRAMAMVGSSGKLILAGESGNLSILSPVPIPYYGGIDILIAEVSVIR